MRICCRPEQMMPIYEEESERTSWWSPPLDLPEGSHLLIDFAELFGPLVIEGYCPELVLLTNK